MTTEYICECEGILDFEDGFYICVNPDCEVITVPSTLLIEQFFKGNNTLRIYKREGNDNSKE